MTDEEDACGLQQRVSRLEQELARERAVRFEAEQHLQTKSLELLDLNRNLAELNQNLEQRCASRTAELERERRRTILLSEQDALTGLANRSCFLSHLERSINEARNVGQQVALLLFDIDRFKQFNDTFGHPCGDTLLIAVAERVGKLLRQQDLFARFGGDEFAIIARFPHGGPEGAHALAQRILAVFRQNFEIGGRALQVNATIGVAFSPNDTISPGDLQRYADLALHAGKISGRNRISLFSDNIRQDLESRWLMEERLRAAIEARDITVYYQPILHLRSGRIAGVEALARWRHSIMGAVPPDQFIQIAEENQLIRELGRQVMAQACTETKEWLRKGDIDFFSVNLSPIQVQDGHEVANVLLALEEMAVDPNTLVLEVTERLMLLDSPEVQRSLRTLQAQGIRLALDDFGAGFSNLSYLNRFPIDRIKIDRSLVTGIETDSFARIIVQSVTDLAHRLGLQVIVEGVETLSQRDILARIGCDYAQGYWFSHPLPANQLQILLREKDAVSA